MHILNKLSLNYFKNCHYLYRIIRKTYFENKVQLMRFRVYLERILNKKLLFAYRNNGIIAALMIG